MERVGRGGFLEFLTFLPIIFYQIGLDTAQHSINIPYQHYHEACAAGYRQHSIQHQSLALNPEGHGSEG